MAKASVKEAVKHIAGKIEISETNHKHTTPLHNYHISTNPINVASKTLLTIRQKKSKTLT